jgi:soluble lytic murein transglycosylase
VLGALARRKEREALPLALSLGDALILDGPRGRVAADAEKLVRSLEARLEFSEQKARRADDAATRIARAERLAASGQEKKAVAILDRLAKPMQKLAATDPTLCRYHLARGRALGLVKRKSEAWQSFDEAGRACKELRPTDEIERARAAVTAGDVEAATRLYAAFEAAHPGHELADDARLEAARALGARGATEAAAELLGDFVARYPKGDRTRDALFERVLVALAADDRPSLRAALAAERSVALAPERTYDRAGRFAYYRGRLAALEGAAEQARAAYETTITEHPLGFYAALAVSELEALERGSAASFLRSALGGEATRPPLGIPARRSQEASVALVLALAGAGDAELTELALRGLRRREPANATWRSVGAELLVLAGDPQRAHAFIRTAREREVPAEESASPFLAELPREAHRSVYLAAYPRVFEAELSRAAAESGVPLELLFAVAREESAFLPRALSVADARGLLQVIPPTAARMARSLGITMKKDTLFDPAANARIGARYLAMLSKRFAPMTPLAIAGYNAGPGAPEKWLDETQVRRLDLFVEQIPYAETRGYVKRVWSSYFAYLVLYGADLSGIYVTSGALPAGPP